jgi:hypothetical protein
MGLVISTQLKAPLVREEIFPGVRKIELVSDRTSCKIRGRRYDTVDLNGQR